MAGSAMIGALRVTLGINTAAFEKGLARIERKLRRAAKQMQNAGRQMTSALSAPIALLGAGVLKAAGDFDQGMANVRAILRPTAADFARLRDLAEELGATTKFTAREAADGMEMLARNGLKATQILDGAVQATLNLASAAGSELAPTADTVTDIMVNFRMRASELTKAVDQAAGVLTNSKMGWEDYANAVGQAAGVAGPMGMSLEDMNAGLAATAASFASGEEAGTSFKGFLLRIAPAVQKSSELIKQLGLEFFDSSGRIRSLAEIAEELRVKVGKLNKESQLRVLGQLFGQRTIRTAARLMEEGAAGIERWKAAIADTSAEEMAKARMDSFWGSVRLLTSALEGLAIAIADSGLLEFARNVVDRLTDVVRSLQQTSPALLRWGTIIAGLTAVFGPLLVVLGLCFAAIAAIGLPVAGVIAALAALTGTVAAFWPEIQIAARVVDNAFGDMFRSAKAWLIDKLMLVIEMVKTALRQIAAPVIWVAKQLGKAVTEFTGSLAGVEVEATGIAQRIAEAWKKAADQVAAENARMAGSTGWITTVRPEVDALQGSVEGLGRFNMFAGDETAKAMQKMREGLASVLSTDTAPIEAKMAAIKEAADRGAIGPVEMAAKMREAMDQNAQMMQQTVGMMGQALTAVFSKSKPAAIAAATINTLVGITQALRTLPPPWSFIQAGAIGAMGFAQVRQIASTSQSGGGGGSGAAGAGAAAAPPPGAGQTLTVQGLSGEGLVSMMSVRSLAEQLVQFQRDGGEVVFAP